MIQQDSEIGHVFEFLVLGGGNASGYVAHEFNKHITENPLNLNISEIQKLAKTKSNSLMAIISLESYLPYERPILSKSYLHPNPEKRPKNSDILTCSGSGLEKQSFEWYKAENISLFLNHRIVDVDVENKEVVCIRNRDKKSISFKYSKLIVATGTRPIFSPDKNLSNIFTLRKLNDAENILKKLKELKNMNKKEVNVTIVGGGYIGLETSCIISEWGYKVTIIFPEHRIMSKVFTKNLSFWFENYLKKIKKIKIIKNTKVKKFISEKNKVNSVVLSNFNENIKTNLVILGVGVTDNTEIFETQLAFGHYYVRGIKVNSELKASDSNVFVVGDVAAVPFNRGYYRFEHVDHAKYTAEIAVKNMLIETHNFITNDSKQYEIHNYTPYYSSKVFEYTNTPVNFIVYGHVGEDQSGIKTFEFGNHESEEIKPIGCLWYDHSGFIIGGILANGNVKHQTILKEYVIKRRKFNSQQVKYDFLTISHKL